jgi:long-chain acyl-CoA synthetase
MSVSESTVSEPSDPPTWGTSIGRQHVRGVEMMMYADRPPNLLAVLDHAQRWPRRCYLLQEDRRYTFADVDRLARAIGSVLQRRHGITRGGHVILIGSNSPEWVIAFWGILRAGGVPVLANRWWSRGEIAEAWSLSGGAPIIGDERSLSGCPAKAAMISMAEMARAADSGCEFPDLSEDDDAIVMFTSGTSGFPKGVVLPHRAPVALLHSVLDQTGRLPDRLPAEPRPDVTLQTGPLFHIGGIQGLMLSAMLGGTIVFPSGRFDPVEVLTLIEREAVTRWGVIPTMLTRVLSVPDIGRYDVSSLRSLTVGGAPVPEQLVTRAREYFPGVRSRVSQIYGLTEAGGTLTMANAEAMNTRPGTSGRPLPLVELRILEPDARGEGEILARTPTQMSRYWQDSARGAIDDEGWLHTGDLGRLDSDGYLFVTGRSKDMTIRGGENVANARVEAVLAAHPDVEAVAVVGLPDDDLGEVVAAAIVPKDGSAVQVPDLARYASEHLAHFEVPSEWWVMTERLPINHIGKVDKRLIVEQWPAPDGAPTQASPSPEGDRS